MNRGYVSLRTKYYSDPYNTERWRKTQSLCISIPDVLLRIETKYVPG